MPAADVTIILGADASRIPVPSQVVEGGAGVVMVEAAGRRVLRSMRWEFPRVAQGVDEPDLVGLAADLTNPMWEGIVVDPRNRCVTPMTHFGNPEGEPGRKTRTWFSVKDQPLMAWAGFWTDTPDAGPVHSGMTMAANAAIPPINDRMPTLLEHHEIDRWLHGSITDVMGFQFRAPFAAERMDVVRTSDRWRGGAPLPTAVQGQQL